MTKACQSKKTPTLDPWPGFIWQTSLVNSDPTSTILEPTPEGRHYLESFGIVWNRPESPGFAWNCQESAWSCVFLSFTLRVHFAYRPLFWRQNPVDSDRFWTTPNDSNSKRLLLRTAPDDSGRLRKTPVDSGRLRTTPDNFNSGRLLAAPDDSERLWTTSTPEDSNSGRN